MEETQGREIYRRMNHKRILYVCLFLLVVVAVFFINMLVNLTAGFMAGLGAIFDPDSVPRSVYNIMHYYRVPESCFGLLTGMALSIAGAEMQTVLNNPLSEPYTLGISAAASFGAALSIAFSIGSGFLGSYSTIILAFLFSMVVCLVVSTVASRKSAGPTTTILIGVAMLFLFQSLVSLVQSMTSKDAASSIMFWMFGSIGRNSSYSDIAILAAVIIACSIFFAFNIWKLTSLKLGDAKVGSMGINVNKLRRNVILGVSVLTATAVSFTGTIGFVGLVGPHIARMLVGEDQRFFLPMSALCGASMVLTASVICKLLPFTSVLPIGVVTSLIGIPFFVYMVIRKRSVIG